MKKLIMATLGAAATVLVLHGAAEAQTKSRLDQILENNTLRYGVPGNFNPMTFRDVETQEYVGFDIDLAKELAKDLGVELKLVPTDYESIVAGLSANLYDVTATASLNVKRALVGMYTTSYLQVGTVPLTTVDNLDRFPTWESINDPSVEVATTLGTVFDEQSNEFFPKANLTRVKDPAREFQEVLAGRADVFITSNLEAATLTENFSNLRIIPVEPRKQRPLAMIVPKGDQVLLNFMNTWIALKETQGFFDDLQRKWGLAAF